MPKALIQALIPAIPMDTIKTHLRLDHSAHDAFLGSLVCSALEFLMHDLGPENEVWQTTPLPQSLIMAVAEIVRALYNGTPINLKALEPLVSPWRSWSLS